MFHHISGLKPHFQTGFTEVSHLYETHYDKETEGEYPQKGRHREQNRERFTKDHGDSMNKATGIFSNYDGFHELTKQIIDRTLGAKR